MIPQLFTVLYNADYSKIINSTIQPPLDGDDVLVKTPSGWWIQAWFDKEDYVWICGDDTFTLEINEVSHWLPVPPELEEAVDPSDIVVIDDVTHARKLKQLLYRADLESKAGK
jgi:hypothetical protein